MSQRKSKKSASQGDILGGEVAIRAHLDQSGLTVGGKSRALVAADRLLGGLIGIPAAYVEGMRRRAELREDQKDARLTGEIREANEILWNAGELGQATARRLAADELRKQINREQVWSETVESLKALPPAEQMDGDDAKTLDEDWINVFSDFAAKASSERLQQLWGRILSGEIRQPGAFALSTLRVISEMDAEIASSFQEIAAHRLRPGILLKPDPFEREVLLQWTFLEEVGLLQDANGSLHVSLTAGSGSSAAIRTDHYCLQVSFGGGIEEIRLPIVKITRVGQQIASILPSEELEALRQLAERIKEDVGLTLGSIVAEAGNSYNFTVVETLRERP